MSDDLFPREEQILNLLNQPHRNKAELIKEFEKAKKEGRREFAFSIAEILDERFPGWDKTELPEQKSKAASAMFRSKTHSFDSAVDAYIWLMGKMIENLPQPLDLLHDDYVFFNLVVHGERSAVYLAKSPRDLFPKSLCRASDHSLFKQLRNGWYLNLHLDNQKKYQRLSAIAAYSKLKEKKDWSYEADNINHFPSLDELYAGLKKRNTSLI